jgi:hypothetical protein
MNNEDISFNSFQKEKLSILDNNEELMHTQGERGQFVKVILILDAPKYILNQKTLNILFFSQKPKKTTKTKNLKTKKPNRAGLKKPRIFATLYLGAGKHAVL